MATSLFLVVIIFGLLTFSRPVHKYQISVQEMLVELNQHSNSVSLNDLSNSDFVLIDLRQTYDFQKGSIDGSINIPVSDILNKEFIAMFDDWQNSSKTVVLFAENEQATAAPWMLLKQLGYQNMKTLAGGYGFYRQNQQQNSPEMQAYKAEQPALDFAEFIKNISGGESVTPKTEPTKILPVQRKKRSATEGGC